jgi:hypothetical protein
MPQRLRPVPGLDEALRHAWPTAWPPDPLVERVRLRASADLPGSDEALGWHNGSLTASGVRLQRDGLVIEGVCAPNAPTIARALRFALQPGLLDDGWLMLHACSARLADGVHVFVAPSGTGKSTLLARLEAAGAEPFGDEVALVGHGACAVFSYQPRAGGAGRREKLAALHWFLRGEPSSESLSPASAVSHLLGQAMVYDRAPASATRALGVLSQLLATTPAYVTQLPDDDRAAAHIMTLAARGAA